MPVGHAGPCHGAMTGVARQGREEMPKRLALGGPAVVATQARPDCDGMIDPCARKGHRALVTGLTLSIRADVGGRLSDYGCAAVATGAVRNESRVVHPGAGEGHRALMATLAGPTSDKVIRLFAGCSYVIVAARAAADDIRVAVRIADRRWRGWRRWMGRRFWRTRTAFWRAYCRRCDGWPGRACGCK
jgi:hypothetical protein